MEEAIKKPTQMLILLKLIIKPTSAESCTTKYQQYKDHLWALKAKSLSPAVDKRELKGEVGSKDKTARGGRRHMEERNQNRMKRYGQFLEPKDTSMGY